MSSNVFVEFQELLGISFCGQMIGDNLMKSEVPSSRKIPAVGVGAGSCFLLWASMVGSRVVFVMDVAMMAKAISSTTHEMILRLVPSNLLRVVKAPDPRTRKMAATPLSIPTTVIEETEILTLRLSLDVQMTTAGSSM